MDRAIRGCTGMFRKTAALTAPVLLASMLSRGQPSTGSIQDVQHVVILMMENRSFDHYFGCLGGVRGFGDRNALLFPNGRTDVYQPGAGSYVLPFPVTAPCITDVDHGESSGLAVWDSGKWDRWVPEKGPATMAYYVRTNLPFYYALADAYTICDANFCSFMGPTFPNRLYLFTGMIDPNGTNGGPVTGNSVPPNGFTWTTYPERLQAAGVSWKVYRPAGDWFGDALPWFNQYMVAQPGNPLYDRGVATVNDVVTAFQQDVTNGTLPSVSWIIPTFPVSEHPPYSPDNGEVFTSQLLNALASDPAVFKSTVFILTYDENGGFFDHVPAPVPPPGTPDEFVNGQPAGLGARVPMIIVSPWTRGGHVCSQVFDHTSIIRFLETWTGVQEPNISAWRRQVCGDLTSAFDFANPDASSPSLPTVVQVNSSPVVPVVPAIQSMPAQETGTKLARPLPYLPDAAALTDCGAGQLSITMTNAGSASVHFAIHSNAGRTDGPWRYDAGPDGSVSDSFAINTNISSQYDFTCYGPNGFERRFAGNLASDCNQIEAISSVDPNAGTITLTMQNATASVVNFVVTDSYGLGGPWTNSLPPGSVATNTFFAVATNGGWYDLGVGADADPTFLRQFTGHVESGFAMPSEPVFIATPSTNPPAVTNSPPPPPTNAAPAITPQMSLTNLLAALAFVLGTDPPTLYASCTDTNYFIVYPAFASNYVAETSASLAPGSWTPLNVGSTVMGTYIVVSVPLSPSNAFFRLRQ